MCTDTKPTNRVLQSLFFLVLILSCLPQVAFAQTIIYVKADATGANDGSSWQNAFTSLQDGRTAALTTPGSAEVWVASGTYYVDQGQAQTPGDRGATFSLISNIPFYGGFSGSEILKDQRNWEENPTIISGDIGVRETKEDNVQTVITANNVVATLDGFIVEGGYSEANAGGLTILNSNVTLNNVGFRFNEYTQAGNERAGAVHVDGNSSLTMTNGFFQENKSSVTGGALVALSGVVELDNVLFLNNEARVWGGAIILRATAAVTISNSYFDSNFTTARGAGSGGAIHKRDGNSSLKIINSRFVNNFSSDVGGALYALSGDIEIINSMFINNEAANDGGAIWIATENATFINNTLAFNRANKVAGALLLPGFGDRFTFLNCIIVDNEAISTENPDFHVDGSNGLVEIGYSLVEKSNLMNTTDLGGNLVGGAVFYNPFGKDTVIGTADDDFSLASTSLGLDTGLNIVLDLNGDNDFTDDIPVDLLGFPRVYDGNADGTATVDMGAVESPLPAPQNLTAESGDSEISLAWSGISAPTVAGYAVYRSVFTPPTEKVFTTTESDTAYLDTGVMNYTTYYYQVAAVDGGGIESRPSGIVNAMPRDLTPPASPTGLEAIAGDSVVTLLWNANEEDDLLGYIIFRDTTAESPQPIEDGFAGQESFVDEGLTNNVTYYYNIAAADTAGNLSDLSEVVAVTPIGTAFLQFVHNAPDIPGFRISVSGEQIVDSLSYKNATDFIELRSVEVELLVTYDPGDGSSETVLDSTITLIDEKTYVFVANGLIESDGDDAFELVLNDDARYKATDTESVDFFVFHGSPDAPTIEISLLDATPNHNEISVLANNLSFGEFTSYRSVEADFYNIEIVSSITGQQVNVYGLDVSDLAGSSVTVVLGGYLQPENEAQPFGVFIYSGELETTLAPVVTHSKEEAALPAELVVHGSYPNPFHQTAVLTFDLPQSSEVEIELYDVLGRRVYSSGKKQFTAGSTRSIELGGNSLAAGIYVYKLLVDTPDAVKIKTGQIVKLK